MFSADTVEVLAHMGMVQCLQQLEAADNLDGVGRQGEPVGPALVVGVARGKERGNPELSLAQCHGLYAGGLYTPRERNI